MSMTKGNIPILSYSRSEELFGRSMLMEIRDWIINIIVMMILSALLDNIMPSGSLRKYCRLVIGLVIMLVIITPLSRFTLDSKSIDKLISEAEAIVNTSNTVDYGTNLINMQNEQIVREYKKKLKENIVRTVEAISGAKGEIVEITMDEDINSDNFGVISFINVIIHRKEKTIESTAEVKVVKPVIISGSKDKERTQSSDEDTEIVSGAEKEMVDEVINELSNIYKIPKNNIKVQMK